MTWLVEVVECDETTTGGTMTALEELVEVNWIVELDGVVAGVIDVAGVVDVAGVIDVEGVEAS